MKTNLEPRPNETGIFDLDEPTYRAMDGVNRTLLEILHNSSPEHAKYYLENPPHSTPSMELGIAVHLACLEPKKYSEQVVTVSSRSAKNKELNPGKTLVLESELETIEGVKQALWKRKIEFKGQLITPAELIGLSQVEKTIVFNDPVTSLRCKGKLDMIYEDAIIDLKTTTSIAQFKKDAYKFGMGRQAAFYIQGLAMATESMPADFYFIVCEKEPPYAIAIFKASEPLIRRGVEETRKALDTISICLQTNEWPSYPCETQLLELPRWV